MKTKLFFLILVLLLPEIPLLGQNYELWGMKGNYIFKTDDNGNNYVEVYNFGSINGYGASPNGDLILASNGKLYGLTSRGGVNIMGDLFEYDREQQLYNRLYTFDGTHGKYPEGSLIQASNGKLYGMTTEGGAHSVGVIFEYDIENDSLAVLVDFSNQAEPYKGASPRGSLFQADNGKLYGLAGSGGLWAGVFFEYAIETAEYQVLVNFNESNGKWPVGGVMQADNGKLYGMVKQGGAHSDGVLFEYDILNDLFSIKQSFNGNINGAYPVGDLIQATDNSLWGLTPYGGTNNVGVIFSYNILTDTIIKVYDLVSDDLGAYPSGSLVQALNGKMYGTSYLGACSSGAIFEYDPVADTSIRKNCNGYPKGSLIEIEAICFQSDSTIVESACNSYVSPSGNYVWNESGIYQDTIPNLAGCDSVVSIDLTINNVDVTINQSESGVVLTANSQNGEFQWLDCANYYNAIEGADEPSYTASENGSYAVLITENNCVDTSECIAVYSVGMEEVDLVSNIRVYPNPSYGLVTIENPNLSDLRISVFSISGALIYSKNNTDESDIVLDISDLQAGVYIVKIDNIDFQKLVRLLKN